jgi:hypothetical protein
VEVRDREGLAVHPDPSEGVVAEEGLTTPPEACTAVCEKMSEALTGVDVSPVCRAGTGRWSQSHSGLAFFACLLPT